MNKAQQLAEKLKQYIPSGDGYNSEFANDLAEAVEYLSQDELIAQRDELLEALIDCRRTLEIANFTQELAVVNAAIAKAKGEV